VSRNNVILGLVIILCATSLIWLQGRFDASDHRKGQRLVRSYRHDPQSETFEDFIIRKHGGAPGRWDSKITEGCRGVVRVTWLLDGDPPTVYAWDVEIPTQEIYAVESSPGGRRLLEEFKAAEKLPPLELPATSR
jgi:hypothetical protein